MSTVFEIEEIVERLFDVSCPVVGDERGIRPIFAPALGELLPDHNVRRLIDDREYYRIDVSDFVDYATSPIAPPASLGMFEDNRALIFESIDRKPQEPLFTSEWQGKEFGVSLLDAIVSRHKVFVSVTARFVVYWDARKTFREQYGELDPDRIAGATVLTTIVLPAIPPPEEWDWPDLETRELEEWDRYFMMPPVPGDPDWRLVPSGVYTDHMIEESQAHPQTPGAMGSAQIEKVLQGKELNGTRNAVFFDLTRLCLALPSYVKFMYDLVVEEAPGKQPPDRKGKSSKQRRTPESHDLHYRVIKSIRVVRPDVTTHASTSKRSWTPPSYRYAVRGHWRSFQDPTRMGKDANGAPELGRTWVTDYEKGQNSPYPFPTSPSQRSSGVIINIKEPLQYGRDVLSTSTKTEPSVPALTVSARSGPSDQWRAKERAKLGASLRYFILARDGFKCRICGKSAANENGIKLEVDHVVPVEQWGETIETNLWILCQTCNKGKGTSAVPK